MESIPSAEVRHIFNLTINGDNAVVSSGPGATQAIIHVERSSRESLHSALRSLGLNQGDLDTLDQALATNEVEEGGAEAGVAVKRWIADMTRKAADGAWKVALEAAPSVLTKALNQYFGLGG